MRLQELQEYACDLSRVQGWDKESLKIRLDYLQCEVKEAMREIEEIVKTDDDNDKEKYINDLGLELFDIIWNVCDIANRFGINLEESSQRKICINNSRNFSESPYVK